MELSYSVYVIIYHGFEFVQFEWNFWKLRIVLMSPGRTKHVYNLRWRSIISRLEKSLIYLLEKSKKKLCWKNWACSMQLYACNYIIKTHYDYTQGAENIIENIAPKYHWKYRAKISLSSNYTSTYHCQHVELHVNISLSTRRINATHTLF